MKFFLNHKQIEIWEFILTIIITAIIAAELLIAIEGIGAGNLQLNTLNDLKTAASTQATQLTILAGEQKQSLDSLTQMNTALQKSVADARQMTDALRAQIKILREDQQDRLAELAKKPKLVARVGATLLSAKNVALQARELTPTKAVLEITLRNEGTATLLYGQVHVSALGSGVALTCDCPFQQVEVPENISSTGSSIVTHQDRLGPFIWMTFVITAQFPKGTKPFQILIAADADNYPITLLGNINVQPPRE